MIIVNNTGESDIESSSRCPRIFLQIGLKFTSNRKTSLLKCVFLKARNFLGYAEKGGNFETKVNKYNMISVSGMCFILSP